METKRWKEGKRKVNKKDEWGIQGRAEGLGEVRKMKRRFMEGPGRG